MVCIHNPKVGGSIPPPATIISVYVNYLQATLPLDLFCVGSDSAENEYFCCKSNPGIPSDY
jgi:hypothetical protein